MTSCTSTVASEANEELNGMLDGDDEAAAPVVAMITPESVARAGVDAAAAGGNWMRVRRMDCWMRAAQEGGVRKTICTGT
jgi:hypothetical protein